MLASASSWWSAKKVAPQLSAAQDCNEDVLRLIFTLCTDSTLAAAARVCRTWTAPAQRELFSVLPTERERRTADPRWSEIARSMEGSAVLRSYLRELRISCWKRIGGVEPFRWLRLLPDEGLILLEATAARDLEAELSALVFSCPALRNLRSLISTPVVLGGTAGLDLCLSNPALGHLGLKPCNTVRRLSILDSYFLDATQNVIRACAAGLQRLDLDVRMMKKYSDLSGILCNLPKLTHLYLAWSEEPDTVVPFLDTVVELLPDLRHLRAGSCLYTAAFFANLPPALETLHLLYFPDDIEGTWPIETVITEASFPVDAAIAGFSAHTMLKEVTLGPHPSRSAPHRPCPSLHEACNSHGIVLHTPSQSFSSERAFFRP
ncbi:hypothetical protein CPB85DRAFT_1461177 [Mucidula mucida]|nr:hypothetical protein CPB85DRAFT_1461177 [Mucidula mucida]